MINKKNIQRNGSQRVNKNGSQKQTIAKVVKNYLDSKTELKWNPFDVNTTVDNTGTMTDLTSISNGTNALTRVGSKITVKSIEMHFQAVLADSSNIIRMRIFEWIPSDTSDIPSNSELQYYSSSVLSPLLPYKPSRFRILYDTSFILDTYHPQICKDVYLELDHDVSYDLGVDTGSRHIYMQLQSNSGTVPHPSLAYNGILRFQDA